MSNKPIYLVVDPSDNHHVHYELDDRAYAEGLASHGRLAYAPCSELARKDALLLSVAEYLKAGNVGAAISAIAKEIGNEQ